MWIIPTSSFSFVFHCWLHSRVMWCSLGLQARTFGSSPGRICNPKFGPGQIGKNQIRFNHSQKVNVTILTRNISKTMTDTRLEALTCKTNRLSIGTITFDLGLPWGVKNQGHTFWREMYQERQQLRCWTQRRLYRLPMGFTFHDLERL